MNGVPLRRAAAMLAATRRLASGGKWRPAPARGRRNFGCGARAVDRRLRDPGDTHTQTGCPGGVGFAGTRQDARVLREDFAEEPLLGGMHTCKALGGGGGARPRSRGGGGSGGGKGNRKEDRCLHGSSHGLHGISTDLNGPDVNGGYTRVRQTRSLQDQPQARPSRAFPPPPRPGACISGFSEVFLAK